jgi:hypothetical protein
MKAGKVMAAAKAAFCSANSNENYWKTKTNNFLKRCGAVLEKGSDQELSEEAVKQVVFAMLDAGTEQIFWSVLGRPE